MNKKEIKNSLGKKFKEEELLNEIIEFETFSFKKGDVFKDKKPPFKYFPLLVSGKIKAFNYDDFGSEIPVYDIGECESCIISITNSMGSEISLPNSRVEKDGELILIPTEKANEWIEKYSSWRNFVVKMYSRRLNELLFNNELISHQKSKIGKQNEQIKSSIRYASRIQDAVLPTKDELLEKFPKHFLLFKPRDIVSGDYYWTMQLKNRTVIAIADCTGHGVPGAFMSMLGISLLNEIVSKNEDFTPGEILDALREKIKNSLRQTGKKDEAKDGMDIAIAIIDTENKCLQFAGAYNPLYLIRNSELMQVKADRMPVGIHLKEKENFTNNNIAIKKDDVIYMFSDGYVDQIGGKKNKKFMRKQFVKLLMDNHKKTMQEQKVILTETIDNWKSDNEQVDDILVMGIKI